MVGQYTILMLGPPRHAPKEETQKDIFFLEQWHKAYIQIDLGIALSS